MTLTVEKTFPIVESNRFDSTIETSIQNMLQALEKEKEHESENIASRLFKKIIGKSDYSPGKYINDALSILDELINDWKNTTVRELSIPQMKIPYPPVGGIGDFGGLFINSEETSFKFGKEPYMLSDKIKFTLIDESTGFKTIDFEKNEDRPPVYLTNEEHIEYLYKCEKAVNNSVADRKVWKYERTLITPVSILMLKNLGLGSFFYESGISISGAIALYGPITFLADQYLSRKMKLISDELAIIQLGIKGEEIVNSHLKMYDDEIINLPNIRLEVEGNSIENDNILLTPYGIFVLEVKNFGSTGSYSLKISKDGKWYKLFKNGTTESIEYDATLQNERHARYLQRYINKLLNRTPEDKDYIKVQGLVIIANNEIDIDNDSEQPIFRISEIYRQVSKNDLIFSKEELLNIKNIIVKDNLPPKKFPKYDYLSEINENMDVLNIQLDSFNDASDWGIVVFVTYLDKLKTIINLVSELESKFGYNLINNNNFLSEINIKHLENVCKGLKKS